MIRVRGNIEFGVFWPKLSVYISLIVVDILLFTLLVLTDIIFLGYCLRFQHREHPQRAGYGGLDSNTLSYSTIHLHRSKWSSARY